MLVVGSKSHACVSYAKSPSLVWYIGPTDKLLLYTAEPWPHI